MRGDRRAPGKQDPEAGRPGKLQGGRSRGRQASTRLWGRVVQRGCPGFKGRRPREGHTTNPPTSLRVGVFFSIEPPLFAFTTLGGSSSSLPPWEEVAPPHPILSRTLNSVKKNYFPGPIIYDNNMEKKMNLRFYLVFYFSLIFYFLVQ